MVTSHADEPWREQALLLDRELSSLSASCDLLLHVTPTNAEAARACFRADGFSGTPHFQYRPLTIDVSVLRRRLSALSVDGLADPALRGLFEHEIRGLELRLGLLEQRSTPHFLELSIALYGSVEPALVETARALIRALPSSEPDAPRSQIDATEFARAAERELEHYRKDYPALNARVELRDDVSSLIVARGKLLVPRTARYAKTRVRALLEHEIGTHLVTYVNGSAQPLKLLQSGLRGHEELQEGLAVFAEFLAGQLSTERLRMLSARVIAVSELVAGTPFDALFELLRDQLGLDEQGAFMTAMRTFRGGGFTKDAVYLRGLGRLLDYLAAGGELRDLLYGKLGFAQLPLLGPLQQAGLIHAPLLLPRYMQDPVAEQRCQRARHGLSLLDLVTS